MVLSPFNSWQVARPWSGPRLLVPRLRDDDMAAPRVFFFSFFFFVISSINVHATCFPTKENKIQLIGTKESKGHT